MALLNNVNLPKLSAKQGCLIVRPCIINVVLKKP